MRKAIVLSAVTFMAVAASALAPAAASAAPPCISNCVVTFAPGPQTTWAVPSNASDVSVVVAAGEGGANTYSAAPGGTGGTATVDLGKAYNGQTLHVVVGAAGAPVATDAPGGGGGGSYVAAPSGFLVIAGGGAGAGALSSPPTPQPGGSGGYSTTSADGGAGTNASGYASSGLGAVGAVPGAAGTGDSPGATGGAGTVSSVGPDGTIVPGDGGAPGATGGYPTAQGGGGYAGGGGGSDVTGGSSGASAGAGGGGSGYIASGLTVSATAANTGAGSITFTYSLLPTITGPTTNVAAGGTSSAVVGTLAPGTAFTVLLSGSNAKVATGTIDASGDPVTVHFTVPAGTSLGSHTLHLVVGGSTVATSADFTVTAGATVAVLAETGLNVSGFVGSGAMALLALGSILLWFSRRRRITV